MLALLLIHAFSESKPEELIDDIIFEHITENPIYKERIRPKLMKYVSSVNSDEIPEEIKQKVISVYQRYAPNKGSVTVGGGYSQQGGWHADVGVSISWAKEQERKALIKRLSELESEMDELRENKGSAHVDGGYSQDGGWHVDGGVSFEWAKQQDGQDTLVTVYRPQIAQNFAIPPWVIELAKVFLEEVVQEIVSRYEVAINWEPQYKGQYQACIISLIDKTKSSQAVLSKTKQVAAEKMHKISIPIRIEPTTYKGYPSIAIYWVGKQK